MPVIELARMPELEIVPGLGDRHLRPERDRCCSSHASPIEQVENRRARRRVPHQQRAGSGAAGRGLEDRSRDLRRRARTGRGAAERATPRCASATRRCSMTDPRRDRGLRPRRGLEREQTACPSSSPPGSPAPGSSIANSTRRSTSPAAAASGARPDRRGLHLARARAVPATVAATT